MLMKTCAHAPRSGRPGPSARPAGQSISWCGHENFHLDGAARWARSGELTGRQVAAPATPLLQAAWISAGRPFRISPAPLRPSPTSRGHANWAPRPPRRIELAPRRPGGQFIAAVVVVVVVVVAVAVFGLGSFRAQLEIFTRPSHTLTAADWPPPPPARAPGRKWAACARPRASSGAGHNDRP